MDCSEKKRDHNAFEKCLYFQNCCAVNESVLFVCSDDMTQGKCSYLMRSFCFGDNFSDLVNYLATIILFEFKVKIR